ncbi:hypothetical protein [uncultured Pseudodesulfovibrio sp.]|uniref:hypothetical protein n=1 Tax=uncultured Pseudodesulfovibrio sp. TaxID=2035858 RepID=UPI0029C80C88|nr:hypothetical protein [uncultured Pseudodesulfovibrio sp.]
MPYSTLIKDYGAMLAPILLAFITYFFASKKYYKQKDYEEIKARYLEGGIDIITANVENSLSNLSANWAGALNIIKLFRGLGEKAQFLPSKEYFIKYNTKELNLTAHKRIQLLIRSNVFWDLHQLLAAFETNKYHFFVEDLYVILNIYHTNERIQISAKNQMEIVDKYTSVTKQINDDSSKYYKIVELLNELSFIFEKEKYSYDNINLFHARYDVVKIKDDALSLLKSLTSDNEQ